MLPKAAKDQSRIFLIKAFDHKVKVHPLRPDYLFFYSFWFFFRLLTQSRRATKTQASTRTARSQLSQRGGVC